MCVLHPRPTSIGHCSLLLATVFGFVFGAINITSDPNVTSLTVNKTVEARNQSDDSTGVLDATATAATIAISTVAIVSSLATALGLANKASADQQRRTTPNRNLPLVKSIGQKAKDKDAGRQNYVMSRQMAKMIEKGEKINRMQQNKDDEILPPKQPDGPCTVM